MNYVIMKKDGSLAKFLDGTILVYGDIVEAKASFFQEEDECIKEIDWDENILMPLVDEMGINEFISKYYTWCPIIGDLTDLLSTEQEVGFIFQHLKDDFEDSEILEMFRDYNIVLDL